MPSCVDCRKFDGSYCTVTFSEAEAAVHPTVPPPPLSMCSSPIVEDYCASIIAGMRVLEIGCGKFSAVQARCAHVGARYDGIDINDGVATRKENLADLSFGEQEFDLVVATQSMEHWAEFGCSLAWGLHQCFRVTRPGGAVRLNFPMHFHGTKTFILGDRKRLAALFAPFSDTVRWESWGAPSTPIPPCHPHPGYWRLRRHPAYVMDVHAIKDRPLPSGYSNAAGRTGYTAKLRNLPPSYLLYAAGRRAGVFPQPLEQPMPLATREGDGE